MKRIWISMAGYAMAGMALAEGPATVGDAPVKLVPVVMNATVDSSGAAQDLSCSKQRDGKPVSENICKSLMATVSAWKFQPGTRAGQAASMDIFLRLGLVAVPQAPGYVVQVTSAHISARPEKPTGSPEVAARTPANQPRPVYPADDARLGREGTVDVEVFLHEPEGPKRIGRTWLNGVESDRRNSLVRAASDVVQHWHFPPAPPEQLTNCTDVSFQVHSEPPPLDRKSPCVERFEVGYALPELITKVGTAD